MTNGITFSAILSNARTTIDGGWRISFDVSQDDTDQITKISHWRNEVLTIAVINPSLIIIPEEDDASSQEGHDA